MASSTDYFSNVRPAVRPRQPSNLTPAGAGTPGSPRTPLLGRSISGQFGSPGTPYRSEQEDLVVYELGARHLSAGFAGDSRPRCIHPFTPEEGRRVGDYRTYDGDYERPRKKLRKEEDWGADHELYRVDIRSLDLGLVEDKLERAVRKIHADFLQLPSQKPLKAVLAIPPLLPTPLLEIALKVLFNHYAQPPSAVIMATPLLACIGAGLRNALVVDMGWEETVVTAVGEYKEISQRRSVRAGKMLTREMARLIAKEARAEHDTQASKGDNDSEVSFEYAEDVTRRMGWCRPRDQQQARGDQATLVKLPHPSAGGTGTRTMNVFFNRLSEPAETTLFPSPTTMESGLAKHDDHELPLPTILYHTLLALPLDLRAVCMSRITFTGGLSSLPGLKHRLLQELQHLLDTRIWNPVASYGSATKYQSDILAERSANIVAYRKQHEKSLATAGEVAKMKQEARDAIPPRERLHDDVGDQLSARAERQLRIAAEQEGVKGVVRGVKSLGAWAGASLVAGLRVKGVHEVEREEFLKHGLRETVPY